MRSVLLIGVSTFQGDVYIDKIGQVIRTFKNVRMIEVTAFQVYPQGRVLLYVGVSHYQLAHLLCCVLSDTCSLL